MAVEPDAVRIDKWLWCVRLFKTRSAAAAACTKGKVFVGDGAVKPAHKVVVGDLVHVRRPDHTGEYRVVKLIEKRVGAPIAVECYADLTPPRERPDRLVQAEWATRERGTGRPTKRDRRLIESMRREPDRSD